MSGVILVTGGTGKTGGRLIQRLSEEGQTVRAASRSGAAAEGAQGSVFDWNDPTSHDAAIDGVDRAYLIAPIGSSTPIDVMEPFIERAIAGGVRRFVLQSSSLIEEGGPAMGAVHALLRQRAPEWAVLRPSWFAENFTIDPHRATIRMEDSLYSATDDGQVPFIAVDDIAEVAMRALTDIKPANGDLLLTGPELLRYDDVAEIIGRARGKPVRHVRLSVEALAARHEKFGIPVEFAEMLAGMDGMIASGAEARTTITVADLTGRGPTSFADYVAKRANLWRD